MHLEELYQLLSCFSFDPHSTYSTVWWRDPTGFSVRATYSSLVDFTTSDVMVDVGQSEALALSWSLSALSNIKLIVWRLILRRLPTKDALAKRGILFRPHNLVCPLCFSQPEDINHIFVHYSVVVIVWTNMFSWFGICLMSLQQNVLSHIVKFNKHVVGKIKNCFLSYFGYQLLVHLINEKFKGSHKGLSDIVLLIKKLA